jgi:hypothetical protein
MRLQPHEFELAARPVHRRPPAAGRRPLSPSRPGGPPRAAAASARRMRDRYEDLTAFASHVAVDIKTRQDCPLPSDFVCTHTSSVSRRLRFARRCKYQGSSCSSAAASFRRIRMPAHKYKAHADVCFRGTPVAAESDKRIVGYARTQIARQRLLQGYTRRSRVRQVASESNRRAQSPVRGGSTPHQARLPALAAALLISASGGGGGGGGRCTRCTR